MATRVGVIGAGVLGGLLTSWFWEKGFEVAVYDPPKLKRDDVSDCSLVYICVPTEPTMEGSLSMELVRQSAELAARGAVKTIVVRSTLLPGTLTQLRQIDRRHRWVHLPEFLTERSAQEDFLNPETYLVGEDPVHLGEVHPAIQYLPRDSHTKVLFVASQEAEIIKLASNAFYATKLSFMNQLYDCLPASCSKGVFAGLASLWMVGRQHTQIHQDGYRGFGGKCLPKDSRALLSYSQRAGAEMSVLRDAIEYNDRLRSL